jgi:transposase
LPLRLTLTPGQAHDVTAARQLLDQAVAGSVVLADKSYDVDWIVDLVQSQGGQANIPMYANRKRNRRDFDADLYKRRNLIDIDQAWRLSRLSEGVVGLSGLRRPAMPWGGRRSDRFQFGNGGAIGVHERHWAKVGGNRSAA